MVKKKKISAGDRTFHIAVLVIVLLMCDHPVSDLLYVDRIDQ